LSEIREAADKSPEKKPLIVEFGDNRLLPALFGEHDQNLARIEQRLGVSLSTRGNRIAVAGPAEGREAARQALSRLYARLQEGGEIAAGDVDLALRLAEVTGPGPSADDGWPQVRTRRRQIRARSANQARYLEELNRHELVLGLGPAGTGKTYLAVAVAVNMMNAGRVDRIILARPAVEAGERLGFLPGDMRAKIDPYLRPLYDALYDMLPAEQVMRHLETGEIEIAPLAFMRGRTLANAFVILDEAQNTTPMQMKMLLTRLGENSRMVVTGDLSQVDLPSGANSGLAEAVEILTGIEGVSFVHFTDADVVRHPLVMKVVRAYAAREQRRAQGASENRGGNGSP
jgi:phosphate starvation-inducible PhoH-like protein